jgi:hypothetical protein
VVRRDGKLFVLIIPSSYELTYYRKHHVWVDQSLLDALSKRHIPIIDFGAEALARTSGDVACSLYISCRRHLNERGYALVAGIVHDHLATEVDKLRESSQIAN